MLAGSVTAWEAADWNSTRLGWQQRRGSSSLAVTAEAEAIEAGAISSVMRCLREHWSNPDIFMWAMGAMGAMCLGLDEAALKAKDAAAEQGAILAAMQGLKIHADCEGFLTRIAPFALSTLATICVNMSSTRQMEASKQQMMLDVDVMGHMLSLLRQFTTEDMLNEIASTFLSGSLRSGTYGPTPSVFFFNAWDGGAMSIIARILARPDTPASTLSSCLRAITTLSEGSVYCLTDAAHAAKMLVHADAFEAALSAVMKCAECRTEWKIVELCLHAIAGLVQAEDATGVRRKAMAIELGVLPYLKATLCRFDQVNLIALYGCNLLYNLSLPGSFAGRIQRQRELLDADLLSTILLVMNAHSHDANVQQVAISTLWTLSAGFEPPFVCFATLAIEANAIESIERAVKLHHDGADVQKLGAKAIHTIKAAGGLRSDSEVHFVI